MERDPRIDDYVAKAADFARPILEHLRATVHAASPDIDETIKWGMSAFTHKGRQLASMAAFKAHATFGFRDAAELLGQTGAEREAMGQFGRLRSIEDLPDEAVLRELVRKAVALHGSPARPAKPKPAAKPEIPIPDDFRQALDSDPAAAANFDAFPPGARREYLEWVTSAKRAETRASRIAQAAEWIAEGKKKNWKYENC